LSTWLETRDTLHLYTQVIGKVCFANEPLGNHWWNSTLYLTARGLTTSLVPHASGPPFQIDFDAEFVLPYENVRSATDPDRVLLSFLQSTYDTAASAAGWDRAALERSNGGDRHG
jgi:hypothetical protein